MRVEVLMCVPNGLSPLRGNVSLRLGVHLPGILLSEEVPSETGRLDVKGLLQSYPTVSNRGLLRCRVLFSEAALWTSV